MHHLTLPFSTAPHRRLCFSLHAHNPEHCLFFTVSSARHNIEAVHPILYCNFVLSPNRPSILKDEKAYEHCNYTKQCRDKRASDLMARLSALSCMHACADACTQRECIYAQLRWLEQC